MITMLTRWTYLRVKGRMDYVLYLLLLLLKLQMSVTERFKVIPTEATIMATVGQRAVLSFHLSPELSAEGMEIGIFRPGSSYFVHLYRGGRDENEGQMQEYQGRTDLLKHDIMKGKATLIIYDITPTDDGPYRCYFQSESYHDETDLNMKVSAIGSDPLLWVEDYFGDGIKAVCESDGWYPRPEVMWRDSEGNRLQPLQEDSQLNAKGLYHVQTSITVYSKTIVFCSIRNALLNEVREPSLQISDTLYRRVNRNGVSRAIIITAFIFSFGAIFISILILVGKKSQESKVKHKAEKEQLIKSFDEKHKTFDEMQKTFDILKNFLNVTKECVTMDPESAHPFLDVSEDGKTVKNTSKKQDIPDNDKRFDFCRGVLSTQSYQSGKHRLDVEADSEICSVGIAKKSAVRKGAVHFNGDDGMYAIRLWEHHKQLISSQKEISPITLKIFLDCSVGHMAIVALDTLHRVDIQFNPDEEVFFFFEVLKDGEIKILS
ncbi:hypothetical protein XENTR_v10022150 [Xenopus tropicalis]|uniref:Butyrophilin subfamily 2 member A2 n=1 Tax=Xenopus tropicalis TaxID=8364 RepID=A0A6I8PY83_XENTR|nr:butyrophilin subfamily 2 member A2 [Xenopus tropicalis]XP_012824656.2 butyrophilin subfamily 2 member A2 [Xenopus tropicalis]KAE8587851.1 hypothetical protein XENTR_v10022150 [Xenopus tropicalis]